MDLLDAQLIEIAGSNVLTHAIYLIDDQVKRLPLGSEMSNQCLIAGLQTSATINQQEHHVGFSNGRHRLARHGDINTRLFSGDTTRINHNEVCFFNAALSVLAIAGQS